MISVIVPVYNVEKYLDKCIKSICEQTYGELEIILVDDGSSDNSGAKCDDWGRRDERIRVIHQKNGGLSAARNTGIDVANGELVAFVDSDDYIHPQMYEILLDHMDKCNADIAVGDLCLVYEDVSKTNKYENIYDISEEVKCELVSGREALTALYGERYVQTVIACNKLFKKSLFEEIRFPIGKIHEDEFTTYRLLKLCNNVIYVDYPMYYYLQRKGSITGKGNPKRYIDRLQSFEEQIVFFDKNEMHELAVKARERWIYYAENEYGIIWKKGCSTEVYTKEVWNRYAEYQRFLGKEKNYSFAKKVAVELFKRIPLFYCNVLITVRKALTSMKKKS